MRSLLVSLRVMLMHPRRRIQVITGAFVIFCILSYVLISPSSSKKEVKEIFAPGPTKEFLDFDYKYDKLPVRSSSISSSTSKVIKEVEKPLKPKRRIQDRPTQSRRNKKQNYLNGVPLGSNLDEFDVIGGLELGMLINQGDLDDR